MAQLASGSLPIPLISSSTPASSAPQGVPEPSSSVSDDPPRNRPRTMDFLSSYSLAPSEYITLTPPARSTRSARSEATSTRSIPPARPSGTPKRKVDIFKFKVRGRSKYTHLLSLSRVTTGIVQLKRIFVDGIIWIALFR